MKKWLFGLLILTILSGVTSGYLVTSIKKDSSSLETYVYAEAGDHKAIEGLEIESQSYMENDESTVEWSRNTIFMKKGVFVPASTKEELSLSEYRKRNRKLLMKDGSVYTEISIQGEEASRIITVNDCYSGEELFRFEIGEKNTNNAVCIGGENCGMAYLPAAGRYYAIYRTDAGTWKTDEYSDAEAEHWLPKGSERKTVAYDGSRLAVVFGGDDWYGDYYVTVLKDAKLAFWGIIASSQQDYQEGLTAARFR